MKKQRINTMEELSAVIGVSRPTLSRYFQNPNSVRKSTSDKIGRGLERVEYVPNFFATRMNRKSTGLIGVIIPHLNDLFFTNLLAVIETVAMEADFTVIAQSSEGDTALEARAIDKFLSMSADGVIVAPLAESETADAVSRHGESLPFVFVDSHLPAALTQVDFVGTDNDQSIGLMVDYLCRSGPAPVFLGMPRVNSNSIERENAYRKRMEFLGHTAEFVECAATSRTWDFEAFGYKAMDKHFSRGLYGNSTILCANDRLAIGAIRAATAHGFFRSAVEGQQTLRIAGHDDHPLSRYVTPSLTTVAQDATAIGKAALDLLLKRVHGEDSGPPGVKQTFDAVLKVRESA